MTGRALTPAERDEQGLLAALMRDLSDPPSRAAYCDWLEENGKLEGLRPAPAYRPPRTRAMFGWQTYPGGVTPWGLPGTIPVPLFALLKDSKESSVGWLYYDTREAALAALRRAAAELRGPATR